ncbi:MAG: hypothetical protein MZV49_21340 [Rhodopseudomonas palustris]|nr:hypothetical protein [Rhodopseudomonas palustris]
MWIEFTASSSWAARPSSIGELHRLVRHLILQDKIDLVHLFTNGSIIPGADILHLLQHRKILVTISSYPVEVSPKQTPLH